MVELQSTNRTSLRRVREDSFGNPPDNPVFKEVRNTSSSLAANPQTVVSDEIRPDRQLTDLILVGFQSGGDVNGQLSFYNFDDDFEDALQSSFSSLASLANTTALTTTTLSVDAGGGDFATGALAMLSGFGTPANNKIAPVVSNSDTTIVFAAATFSAEADTPDDAEIRIVGFAGTSADVKATTTDGNALTATTLDFTAYGLKEGQWIKIGETGHMFGITPACNGFARIAKDGIAAGRLDLDVVPAGWAADAGTGVTLHVFAGDFITNASVMKHETFERQYLDHDPVTYEYFKGQALNTMVLTLGAQTIINVAKTYIGAAVEMGATRMVGATDEDALPTSIMNTSTDVADIAMDGVEIDGPNFVLAATLTINNNLRLQNAIGHVGAVGIGNGEFNVTLSQFQTYFGSPAIYQKVLDGTKFGFSSVFQSPKDDKRTAYMIDLPSCKVPTGAPSISGKNADVTLDGSAQALMHPDLGFTMGITRFRYLPE